MGMRTLIRFLLVFCSAFAIDGPAQQSAAPAQPSGSHSIVLDVVVTDKSGKPVSGLQQEDFSLLDDKTAVKMTAFHATAETADAADSPRQVVFVVDAVNGSSQTVSFEKQQLQKMLQQDSGHLAIPTTLAILTDSGSQIQSQPTLNGNDLANALNESTALRSLPPSRGLYAGNDRIQVSMHALQDVTRYAASQPGRKFVIWLSAGWPLLTGPRVDLTLTQKQTLFRTVVAISQQLREARLTLYAVDPLGMNDAGTLGTVRYGGFLKGVTAPTKVEYGNLALQVLAIQSGGLVLNSSNDLQKMIATTLTDAKAYYTLSFDAPPADHADEFHALEVKVDKPGLTARTRTGYYAEPYQAAGR